MALQVLYLLLSTSTVTNVATTHLHKREDGLKCEARDSCVSWYTTGSAQCASGYKASYYEAKGEPVGTYCETACSKAQKDACETQKCSFFSSECNTYPSSRICADAMTWCNAPKAMPKASCTQTYLGFAVVYNAETGECSIDENPDTNEHYLRFRLQKTNVDLGLFMICAPITLDGAQYVADNITAVNRNTLQGCKTVPDSGQFILQWFYKIDKSRFDKTEKAAKAACADASYPGAVKPVFSSARG